MALSAIRFTVNDGFKNRQSSLKIHIFLILFYSFCISYKPRVLYNNEYYTGLGE